MAELTQVHDPVNSAGKPRIVFIHGLDGDHRTTWMSNAKDAATLWPVWLGQDTGCPVWLLGFGAAMSRWKADAMAIPPQATAVLECLSSDPAMQEGPLVLVGHSLGGVIIKTAMNQGMRRDVERHRRLVTNVKGIAFVGTPHFGSNLASLASSLHLMRPNPQVANLGMDDAHLAELNQFFLELLKELDIRTRVYVEAQPLRLPGILGRIFPGVTVVSPASSQPHIPGEAGTSIEANHTTICKPQSRRATIHKSMVALITEVETSATQPKTYAEPRSGPLPSDRFEAVTPEDRPSTSVHLAMATHGLTFTASASADMITSLCLVTDEPERVRKVVDEIRDAIRSEPLVAPLAKQRAMNASLLQLVQAPATRGIALRTLAVTSFSAYLYYCQKLDFDRMSPNERIERLLVQPLVHRLSKKGERIEQVHSRLANVDQYVQKAAQHVQESFHRSPVIPHQGNRKLFPIEEVAAISAMFSSAHLSDLENAVAGEVFESLRTRIRYGENVATGEKHKRDLNPLP